MTKEKTEIGFIVDKRTHIDFGNILIAERHGTLNVDKELWGKYVTSRFEYETLHAELVRKGSKAFLSPKVKKLLEKKVMKI